MPRSWAWLALFVALLEGGRAQAQCGAKRSSCSACHDGSRATLPAAEPWHEDHAFADLCASCHGGHGETSDLAAAHASLGDPLARPEESCGPCHGAGTGILLERYRGPRDAGAAARGSAPSPPSPHGAAGPNAVLTALVGSTLAVGILLVRRGERARVRPPKPA